MVFGSFEINLAARRLTRDGQEVALRPRYFDVLVYLAGSGGRLVSKEELLDAVWGHRHVSDSVLKVAINALRMALGDDAKAPRHLETVSRRGYRFLGVRVVDHGVYGAANAEGAAATLPATMLPQPAWLGNLPGPLCEMVGRAHDLEQLLAALASHRLVTLHGASGAGKTTLALAGAHRRMERDGVWMLRLDALVDGTPLLHALARTLKLGDGADASVAALARALAPWQALFVLDNAEHLAATVASLVTAVLEQAPGVRLLVTSQVPLRVRGEHVQQLPPLALPAVDDHSANSASVQLLLQRARQRQAGMSWDEHAAAHAGAICRHLDGLPLALELAAARLPLLGWAGVHERLGERLALLTKGERDAPPRQRTLRAALTWSCALLKPSERSLLHHLSLFAGSFSLQDAAAVAGVRDEVALLDQMEGLLEHALMSVAETAPVPRWRLFESVRSFAAEGLRDGGQQEEALQRLLEHLSAVFEQADRRFAEVYQLAWLRSLEVEADNLRGAIHAAWQRPSLRLSAVRLFCASAQYRSRAGWRRELRHDHAVVAAWPQTSWPPALRAAFDLALAQLSACAQVFPPDQALAAVRRAQRHYEKEADAWTLYTALNLEAALQLRLGAPHGERQATVARMQAMHAADWSPASRRHGNWQAVQLLRQSGDDAAYEAMATAYLETSRTLGDQHGAWAAAQVLAQMKAAQGHFDIAISLLGHTVSEMRTAGQLRQNTPVLAQWVLLRLTQGADAQTLQLLQEALQALQAEGMLWWLADALPWVPAQRGSWRDAIKLQSWADGLVRQRGEQRGPLFGAARRRWDALLDSQPQAAQWRASWPDNSGLDELSAMGLAFGTL